VVSFVRDITQKKLYEQSLKDSSKLINALFDAIGETLIAIDTQGMIIAANSTAAERFELSRESFIGMNIRDIPHDVIPEDIQTKRWTKVKDVITSGQSTRFVAERNDHYYDTCFYPVTSDQGTVTHVVIYAREITVRVKQEQRLRESEEKFRTLVNAAPEEIGILDRSGTILFVNQKLAKRYQLPPEAFLDKPFSDFVPKSLADKTVTTLEEVINTRQNAVFFTDLTVQGKTNYYELSIVPLSQGGKTISNVMLIAKDITEINKSQRTLREFSEQLVDAKRLTSIGTVSAMAAHELAQPLTVARLSVQNALSALQDEQPPYNSIQEELTECLKGIEEVHRVVKYLRNFAKKEILRCIEELTLHEAIGRIIDLLTDGCRQSHLTIDAEQLKSIRPIWSSLRDLEQLSYILIENSIQACDGSCDHTLAIEGRVEDEQLLLTFADDCGGVPVDSVKNIFEPFFTTKNNRDNMGLGLSVVDKLVRDLEGTIQVNNRPGKGVTFILQLPLIYSSNPVT
jgi:two-component system cell cycle sensor histidine kinase/response regulator CckA